MADTQDDHTDREQRVDEAIAAYLEAERTGKPLDQKEWLARHPELATELESFLADRKCFTELAAPLAPRTPSPAEMPTLAPGETSEPPPGTTLRYFGDYELLEEIARGGMGVVYKARQVSLNRLVALKMILAGQLAGPDDVRRFQTEAEAAANLDHPNIVPIYEVGEHEGQHYFSMKLIDGGSLTQAISSQPSAISQKEAARLIAAVARAVHYAHQRGILHRDLKPGNILLASVPASGGRKPPDGREQSGGLRPPLAECIPFVTDFGLAKRIEGDSKLTRSGAIVGTPSYMAPEQARGEKGLSVAADVYSLGAILYELLTGRPPFQAATPLDTVLQVLDKEPERPRLLAPQIDRDLETICLKCLDKDPKRRYESAAGLAHDLEHWLAGETITARRSSAWERAVRWAKRRPALAGMVTVSAISLLGLLILAGLLWQNAEQRAGMVKDLETAHRDLDQAREERATTFAERAAALAQTRDLQDKAARIVYDVDMQFAHAAYRANDGQGLLARLEQYQPKPGQEDRRGFEWRYLWRLCHAERFSLNAHPIPAGTPTSGGPAPVILAFSPDGKMLATTSLDKQIKLWDSATGELIRTLPLADPVVSFTFTSNGKELHALVPSKAKADPKVFEGLRKLMEEAAAGKAKPSLQGLLDCFAFQNLDVEGKQPARMERFNLEQLASPLSMFLLMARPEMAGAMLTGIIALKGQIINPMCLALSPDRKTLAIAGLSTPLPFQPGKDQQESVVLLWDLAEGKEQAILKGHTGFIIALAFAPDGRRLASAGSDKTIRFWSVEGNAGATLGDLATMVTSLAYSADGKVLATGSADGAVNLLDAANGGLQKTFIGHTNPVVNVALTPDGKTLASASVDGIVKLWDATEGPGPVRRRLGRRTLALALSPNGRTLTVVDQAGIVHFYDPVTGREQRTVPTQGEARAGYQRAAISPNGKTVAVTDLQTVSLAEIDSTKQVQPLENPGGVKYTVAFTLDGKVLNGVAYTLAFSPDGKTLALGTGSARKSGEIVLWDLTTKQRRAVLPGHSNHVVSLAFSPDGKTLASGSLDKTVKIWDIAANTEVRTISGFAKDVSALAYTRDGHKLAIAASDTISIRDTATGEETLTLRGYSLHIIDMAFSDDGARLATAAGTDIHSDRVKGGGVRLWDLTTGQEVLNLAGPTDIVTHVAFSPDGRRLVSASTVGGGVFQVFANTGTSELAIWDASTVNQSPER
jgi:WD40 repeat protein